MKTVVVCGVIANKLHNGGAAWTRLSWGVGLARLGYRVIFIEQIEPQNCIDDGGKQCEFQNSANLRHFRQVTQAYGLAGGSSLIFDQGKEVDGLSLQELATEISQADFLLNISGHLAIESLLSLAKKRIYLDLDPGYTQHWHAQGQLPHLLNHNYFFTVGLNIGQSGCTIPTGDIRWQSTLQPVVLDDWPMMPIESCNRFTTIASWRGPFGAIESEGQRLGPKAHEFRKYIDLPHRVNLIHPAQMEIALQIDPADSADRAGLIGGGWSLADPRKVASTPEDFRRYIQQSSAEFSVAQGIYVQTKSGWFSDRTVRYFASGRPVVVQDTGFAKHLPVGKGLLCFSTADEALQSIHDVQKDYAAHCKAARDIAEKYFDSNIVLASLIDRIH